MAGIEPTSTESKSVALPLGHTPISKPPIKVKRHPLSRMSFRLGWMIGFEPTTPRATTWYSNQLSYIHRISRKMTVSQSCVTLKSSLARLEGLEPPTHCLEGSCSIHLSYRRVFRVSSLTHNRYFNINLSICQEKGLLKCKFFSFSFISSPYTH